MNKEYIHYKTYELLCDDSFLCWKLFSSEEDCILWEGLLEKNPELKSEIDKATKILKSVTLNNYKLSPDEKDDILQAIKERINIQKRQKRRRTLYSISGIAGAAAIALFIVFNFFYFKESSEEKTLVAGLAEKKQNGKDILLILADDEVVTLEQNSDIQYKSDGNIVISNGDNEKTTKAIDKKQIRFNKLVVPSGKRSFLVLEDGTKIWINSGSTLEFPPVFQDNHREIRAEGEIYIEVAKDENRPFYINTTEMKVKVLGTRFNVSAYKDESAQSVVLVEGKVAVTAFDQEVELRPDLKLTVAEGRVKTEKVNVYNYISWKDGLLQYSGESLASILNKLSRYYDIPITYDKGIENMKCDGKLVLFDNIQDIMETIHNTNPIEYNIKDGHITVQKK
ncbi:FecR family protein [Dysgonomonas termitidis]|uniref:FecR family protein n=1 Tax=Dysgonomonas termitidis TaxID=1516126 RepID=A0ABV9KWV2_9BACT